MASALMSGCSGPKTEVERGNRAGILHVGNGGEPATLDPQVASGNPEYYIDNTLFEGLVTQDPTTLAPRPGVAERWETSSDGLVYTFHLRPNAKWSNGAPVIADDFIFSFRRILSPDLGSEYQFMLFDVKNARSFARREIEDFTQVGFSATDAHTRVVTLEN